MKIQQLYDKYKIMPQLQLHMLRVAGVASIIADNFIGEIDKHSIVSTALLHDMGNIIKFDLSLFPDTLEPQGLKYWQQVKDQFIKKYGNEEHIATNNILNEIRVDYRIKELINSYGFSKGQLILESGDFDLKIAAYSDQRVMPNKIESIKKRVRDLRKRYKNVPVKRKRYETLLPYWIKIEQQIFASSKIKPHNITNEKVEPLLQDLRNYEIE